MYTVIETEIFVRAASEIWTEAECASFINWLAINPEAGDVIPGSGGCRKVRWARAGMGKRGGARVIYPKTAVAPCPPAGIQGVALD